MDSSPLEIEIKIRLRESDPFPDRLFQCGFHESIPRGFEANTLYDTADGKLRLDGALLRVRQVHAGGLLTWKGRSLPGPHKSRPELETTLGSAASFEQILKHLGYIAAFRYEKYRTEYRRDERGVATFDETPIGRFLELEGPNDWIDETALLLGFGPDRYVLESYGRLYVLDCEARGTAPSNMTFDRPK